MDKRPPTCRKKLRGEFAILTGVYESMKTVCILGSTGSIGVQSVAVCKANGYKVTGLAAKSSTELLARQAHELRPEYVCIYEKEKYSELKALLSDIDNIEILTGMDGLCFLASRKADVVLNAVVGTIGLEPTLAAIAAKNDIALANKETLVTGGTIVMNAAKKAGINIYPVDSEHSAIFQSLLAGNKKELKKIILTASGGPFFGKTKDELAHVKKEDALKHPNWSMGAKITIDSATMMNKGLEVIEACHLFGVTPDKIDVVVHRQSIVHSLVEFCDNAVIAQLGTPDMTIPIQYALSFPQRLCSSAKELSLTDCGMLTFEKPDYDTFTCLKACSEAFKRGGLYPAIVNGANEQAVKMFLNDEISFLDIGRLVYGSLSIDINKDDYDVEDIKTADKLAREYVRFKKG